MKPSWQNWTMQAISFGPRDSTVHITREDEMLMSMPTAISLSLANSVIGSTLRALNFHPVTNPAVTTECGLPSSPIQDNCLGPRWLDISSLLTVRMAKVLELMIQETSQSAVGSSISWISILTAITGCMLTNSPAIGTASLRSGMRMVPINGLRMQVDQIRITAMI